MLRLLQRYTVGVLRRPLVTQTTVNRFYCDDNKVEQTEGEKHITEVLRRKFPAASFINVSDISGGCGSMYEIQLESVDFAGKRTVAQHRMVNEALKSEISEMHGVRISTMAPQTDS